MRKRGRILGLGLMVAAAMLLGTAVGCGGNSALNPNFQPQVNNAADNFQFQSTGMQNVTQTLQYNWQNSGTHASTNQACSINPGSAFLTLRDATGKMVYSGDLAANGTFTSVAGTAGTWTVQVSFSNTTGTVNFRAQMAP
jgi:hypothetical protein